jgi:tRNA-Thr(GGU) m(6)t(6)A37 methyltransferase TsaA
MADTAPDPPGDIREGEISIALPDHFDAGLYFIGQIRTPWKKREDCPRNARESDSICSVEVEAPWAPALRDLETCSHVILLYWMHHARRDLILQAPRHYGRHRGTFALRSPVRPNPLALSVARLLEVNGSTLRVQGVDCFDGTPLLDIKPYFASTDAFPDAQVGWHADTKRLPNSR